MNGRTTRTFSVPRAIGILTMIPGAVRRSVIAIIKRMTAMDAIRERTELVVPTYDEIKYIYDDTDCQTINTFQLFTNM